MQTFDLAFHPFGNPDSPPLVLLHGLFASSRNWFTLAKKFSSRFYVIAVDLRNHGNSPHAEAMDYPHMANDLSAFLERQNLTGVTLIGHSMGGKAAMWLALNRPERIGRLIIADIAPVSYRHDIVSLIHAMRKLPIGSITSRKEAEQYLSADIETESLRQFLLQNLVPNGRNYRWRIDLDILLDALPAIIAFPATDAVSPFTGRTLFLAGEHSDYIRPSQSPLIQRLFPDAHIDTILAAGHWLHAEKPDDFAAKVLSFLDS